MFKWNWTNAEISIYEKWIEGWMRWESMEKYTTSWKIFEKNEWNSRIFVKMDLQFYRFFVCLFYWNDGISYTYIRFSRSNGFVWMRNALFVVSIVVGVQSNLGSESLSNNFQWCCVSVIWGRIAKWSKHSCQPTE